MQKVIDYYLCPDHKVSVFIKDGWQPWGSAVAASWGTFQPLVRYAPDPVEAVLGPDMYREADAMKISDLEKQVEQLQTYARNRDERIRFLEGCLPGHRRELTAIGAEDTCPPIGLNGIAPSTMQ